MRFEETKNKNLDKIYHLQSLLKEKKNEEQGIRVLRKGGEEWSQECLWFKGSCYELVQLAAAGEVDEDTSGEHRVLAVFFVLCAVRKVDTNLFYALNKNWILLTSSWADALMKMKMELTNGSDWEADAIRITREGIGLIQTIANKLCTRYDEGAIPDLIIFFFLEWAMGLLHDHLPPFVSSLESELMKKTEPGILFCAFGFHYCLCVAADCSFHMKRDFLFLQTTKHFFSSSSMPSSSSSFSNQSYTNSFVVSMIEKVKCTSQNAGIIFSFQ
ncbi:uncharacterized protein MONOS_18047 [Monocercomonoides exilis]|uniref:uncharacterized protein n=1 Tax=Monocercomonoides exilis TaxID=2049356 RepID=UPI00355A502E|nr:hypothetical protein MONOS_18047 [Monocercomonoides exilis]